MSRSINFVQARQKQLSQATIKDKRLRSIAAVVFAISLGLFIISLIVRFLVQQTLSTVQARQEQVKNAISSQESVERDYTLFIYKLQSLTKLFEERKDKQEAISYFADIFGDDVTIKGVDYSAEEQQLMLTLQAKDVFTLESVYSIFTNPNFNEQYTNVKKSGLRRDSDGSYIMDVTVNLGTKK